MSAIQKTDANNENWKSTACMLCSIGCAIEVQVDGQHLKKVRGDKSAASSEGYLCQKAARLDHYQNHSERLTKPLRKKPDGQFEEVEWDEVINEIAGKMKAIRSQYGGHAFAYYGGGGQGNHLGGTYSSGTCTAPRCASGTSLGSAGRPADPLLSRLCHGPRLCRLPCHLVPPAAAADRPLPARPAAPLAAAGPTCTCCASPILRHRRPLAAARSPRPRRRRRCRNSCPS